VPASGPRCGPCDGQSPMIGDDGESKPVTPVGGSTSGRSRGQLDLLGPMSLTFISAVVELGAP
jgi:hypothetical protein